MKTVPHTAEASVRAREARSEERQEQELWRRLPLSSAAHLSGGFAFKSKDYSPTGRFVLRTLNIMDDGSISRDDAVYLPEELCPLYSRFELRPQDTLFVMVGATLGKVGYVREEDVPALLNQNMWLIRAKPEVADPRFLHYAFRDAAKDSLGWASGSARDFVRRDDYRNMQLPVPPLPQQRAIAHVLGTLDDKIELNRRMNETLEAMARAIFKSWFVDFDPVRAKAEGRQPFGLEAKTAALFPDSFEDSPLGEIPAGWRVGSMSELLSLSREAVNPGDSPGELFDHYSIPAYDEGRWPNTESGEQIKSNKFLVPSDAVLLSKLNPRLPRVWLPTVGNSRRPIASTEFLVAQPQAGFSREYIFALLSSQNFLRVFQTLVTGTSGSHQRVRPESLLAMDVVVPSRQCVKRFTCAAEPLLARAARNLAESRTLAAIRDALLPKLISGEIRVSGRGLREVSLA